MRPAFPIHIKGPWTHQGSGQIERQDGKWEIEVKKKQTGILTLNWHKIQNDMTVAKAAICTLCKSGMSNQDK